MLSHPYWCADNRSDPLTVFPILDAGQILQKCGYYAGTFSFEMRVLCGY
jgi:hypothetical protein